MQNDKLITCPRCGSDACYHQEMGADYTIKLCYGCGFTTNALMHTESEFLQEQIEVLPELYKDLIYTDLGGLKWIPSATNNPEKGMVYADGSDSANWKWAAVKAIPSEEKTYKMDMENLKHFDERDYMEALDYIGMFEKE
jgi:ribosomal protein L37E